MCTITCTEPAAIFPPRITKFTSSRHCWTTHSPTMQKVIQRTATARKQAQKKVFRAKQQNALVDRKDTIRVRKDYNRALIDNIKGAREARWEDWQKGDLAPKRDAGPAANIYGSLGSMLLHPPRIPKHLRRKHILFAAGDRVVVIRGRDKGKINEITQVNEDSETVVIKDINQVRSPFPIGSTRSRHDH